MNKDSPVTAGVSRRDVLLGGVITTVTAGLPNAIAAQTARKPALSLELAPYRIRGNAVAPGPTETGMLERSGLIASIVEHIKDEEAERVPLERRGTSEEVAAWIVDVAHPTARWMTGQVIAIDEGLSIA
jgi:NAD(P)-dependent dehydrogenase (short-subunit alcohol dehydrogenase family)